MKTVQKMRSKAVKQPRQTGINIYVSNPAIIKKKKQKPANAAVNKLLNKSENSVTEILLYISEEGSQKAQS